MTREEAKAIIQQEYQCVDRDCDRECGKCDLMMPSKEPILEAYKMAIQALEQEPCEDVISRDAVWDVMQELWGTSGELLDRLMALPSVKPQEPKTGHWIEHPEIETSTPEYLMFYECSECGDKQCFCKSDIHKKRFCGNCGCRMVKPQESEG